MKRIFLFLVTNRAVLAPLSLVIFVIEQVVGVRLGQRGLGGLRVSAAIVGGGGALLSPALSTGTAKRMLGVRVVTFPRSVNAFATGSRRNATLAAVSTGLLRGRPRPQAQAVLGHEISHVANGDRVTMTLPQGVLNTFVIFVARIIGSIVDRALFKNGRGESGLGFL